MRLTPFHIRVSRINVINAKRRRCMSVEPRHFRPGDGKTFKRGRLTMTFTDAGAGLHRGTPIA
jgi:hypothetical protein